ncbi:protoporphyrinogen oxidase HemJ [Halovulum sp. GXIMD14793]
MLSMAYPWIKALHVMAVIAWMAGLFYLPRLFVYHAEKGETGSELSEVLKVMELKLLRVIMNPAMVVVWLCGIIMIVTIPELLHEPWMWVKLAAVTLMTGFHHWLALRRKDFASDRNQLAGRSYRIANELPTVLMVVIVTMVVVQPF